ATVVTARAMQRGTSASVILAAVRDCYEVLAGEHRAATLEGRLKRLRATLGPPARQPMFILLSEREARTLQVLAERIDLSLSALVTLSMHAPVGGWAIPARTDAVLPSNRAVDRRSEMRDHIRRTALDRFGERGYRATTIDDIVGAAYVSRRTFF